MAYPISRYLILPFIRRPITSVKGLENIPSKGPFIIAANHISQTDPFFIFAPIFDKYHSKVHFIARRGNYGQAFEKLIATRWAGCILINPWRPSECLDRALELLNKGQIVGIFPEGESASW